MLGWPCFATCQAVLPPGAPYEVSASKLSDATEKSVSLQRSLISEAYTLAALRGEDG